MKPSKAHQIKSKVIIATLDFIETGDNQKRLDAIELINELAKFYTVPLRRKATLEVVKSTLRAFILNEEGYSITIPRLYHSLHNSF